MNRIKMKREIHTLVDREYDLLIVGGGIFGAFAAWDAALRGLSVAIVEKGDFSHATSANHFKMIHGGIRYLQHGDIPRIRESSRERSALLRIAPHLTQPLPIVIPTYGHGVKGKTLLSLGMWIYDMLTMDKNRGIQEERKIPKGQWISRQEVVQYFPGIQEEGLTGGAVFYDGQFYHPPRLTISILRSAVDYGLKAANYVEVVGFLRDKDRVYGAKARDTLTGEKFEIRSKVVLNTTGPWAYHFLESTLGLKLGTPSSFSRDLAFVVKRRWNHNYGIASLTQTQDTDAWVDRGSRHLFAVPWKEYTLVGVWPLLFKGVPENITVSNHELEDFAREANQVCPGLDISVDDILMVNTGLTLYGERDPQNGKKFSYGHRSQLIDHHHDHGLEGLVTLIGVRATTARGMAKLVNDLIARKLKRSTPECQTETTPIYGGDIESFNSFLNTSLHSCPSGIPAKRMEVLLHHYGSKYQEVLKYHSVGQTIGNSSVLRAEVIHAVREEMAQKLTDVVYRRTDMGTAGYPGDNTVRACAEVMAEEMKWSSGRKNSEINEVKNVLPQFC